MIKSTFTSALVAGLAVAGLTQTADASKGSRAVFVVNMAEQDIHYIHATHIHDEYWGNDLLGSNQVVPVDDYEVVAPRHPDGYCLFDMKITFADTSEMMLEDVNLCDVMAIAVDDLGNYLIE